MAAIVVLNSFISSIVLFLYRDRQVFGYLTTKSKSFFLAFSSIHLTQKNKLDTGVSIRNLLSIAVESNNTNLILVVLSDSKNIIFPITFWLIVHNIFDNINNFTFFNLHCLVPLIFQRNIFLILL